VPFQFHLVHISAKCLHHWEVIKDLQICKQIREREPSRPLESWGFPYEYGVYIPAVLIKSSRIRRQIFPPSSEAVS